MFFSEKKPSQAAHIYIFEISSYFLPQVALHRCEYNRATLNSSLPWIVLVHSRLSYTIVQEAQITGPCWLPLLADVVTLISSQLLLISIKDNCQILQWKLLNWTVNYLYCLYKKILIISEYKSLSFIWSEWWKTPNKLQCISSERNHFTNVNAFTFWPISYAWLTEKRT